MAEQAIVPAAMAHQYELHMNNIAEAVPEILKRNVQLWRSVFEIYTHQLWRADVRGFHSQEDWIGSLNEDYHIPRSTVMQRMSDAQSLIARKGVDRLVAIDSATLVPTAARRVSEMSNMVEGDAATAYMLELVALPPAEAVARVQKDAGTSVTMWAADVQVSGQQLLARIARSDSDGFKSFDVRLEVLPSEHPDLEQAVLQWLEARLKRK